MSTPHDLTPDRERMLDERLSQDELRVLLERLESHDRNEADMPTVGAVAEATGKEPELIHRLLREVRHQPPQVFEPTVQADQTSRRGHGSAFAFAVIAIVLGLWLVLMVLLLLTA